MCYNKDVPKERITEEKEIRLCGIIWVITAGYGLSLRIERGDTPSLFHLRASDCGAQNQTFCTEAQFFNPIFLCNLTIDKSRNVCYNSLVSKEQTEQTERGNHNERN